MLLHLAYASGLVAATVLIHAALTLLVVKKVPAPGSHTPFGSALVLSAFALTMLFAMILEAMLWAFLYLGMDLLPNFEEAFYFSLVTFTTLGYGDVTLESAFRSLAAVEGVNGVLICGWSTALLVGVATQILMNRDR